MDTKIPRWNLDSIFSSIESDEYKQALSDYTASMDTLESLLDTAKDFTRNHNEHFDFPAWLATYLTADNKVNELAGTLNAYAYVIYSVDTTNTAFLNNITSIEEMGLRVNQLDLAFKSILLSQIGRAHV